MNRNNKIIRIYELINRDEVLLQSLKAGDEYLCSKCETFKSVNEFSKNQKWCKGCMKTKVSTELVACECGQVMHLRAHKRHLLTKSHSKRMDNMSKENTPQE
ncbi:unnamed protein product [Macrosiphum euphorbiae]|uniref:C2H2-type domain-containing protein n=1 Tax=Macrosiphum euphorbiae TaxID=13131 RepID=A0AAV0XSP4_9HEMI|nr:unnamed protein product [Macrosiphum euphorbiae]